MSQYPKIDLDGAVVVVTGGARGIGLATATRFVSKGARVAIGDLTLDAAVEAAESLGSNATGYQVDVGSRGSYVDFIERVESEVGPIDVLVNNAGIMPVGGLLDEDDAVAVATMAVNFWAHYHGFKVVAPLMISRGSGHIINVTSGAGKVHSPGLATYVAAKHAATGLSRSVREELAGTGVSVTAVLPSAVKTQLVDGIPLGFFERLVVVSPAWVARTIVATLDSRPALIGAPPGLVTMLNLAAFVPEPIWQLGRRIVNADRTMGPIDRVSRKEYDSRIELQTAETANFTAAGSAVAASAPTVK